MAISVCNVHTNPSEKDTTPYGSAAFPVAFFEDDMQKMAVPIHWHDEFEYILAVRGTVSVVLDGEEILLKEGEAVFINSGCLHCVRPSEGKESVLRSVVMLPKFAGGSPESCFWQQLILPFSGEDAPSFVLLGGGEAWQNTIADEMMAAWAAVQSESYDYENEARYHISKALRILADRPERADNAHDFRSPALKRVKTALAYMEEHYREELGNGDLMRLCCCSESVLLRSFHQIVETSPMQYLQSVRLRKASELLLTTEMRCGEVAASCGFHDFSYFTKIFKRSTGSTPMDYRKQQGKKKL